MVKILTIQKREQEGRAGNGRYVLSSLVATYRHKDTQTEAVTGNGPSLYTHMPIYVIRSHAPGAAPGPPVKTGARFRPSGSVMDWTELDCTFRWFASSQSYRSYSPS